MSKTIEQIREELDKSIPRDVISERDGGSGKKLSYLAGWYVIDRMNQVFGQGNWCYRTASLTKTFEGTVEDSYGKSKHYVSYVAQVHLIVLFEGRSIEFSDVGFGDGQDKNNPGKAHELAVKEAVTDGIKRCAKSLGMSMGLALYDKSQEFVEDTPTQKTDAAKEFKKAATGIIDTLKEVKESSPPAIGANLADNEALKSTIQNAYRVLSAQKKITKDQFQKDFLSKHANGHGDNFKVKDLTVAQAKEVMDALKSKYKELNLN